MESVFLDFPPLPNALEQIAELREEQFGRLREAVAGDAGLDISYARSKEIADKVGGELSARDVYNIVRSVIFLRNRFIGLEASDADLQAALPELFEFIGLDKFVDRKLGGRIYQRVEQLVRESPEETRDFERQRLQTSIIDTAVDFDYSIDLRPRFSDDGSEVQEFVPAVIFRAVVANDREEKAHVFQLTEETIEELELTLEMINHQLETLRRHRSLR
jgi:hypothetical protein